MTLTVNYPLLFDHKLIDQYHYVTTYESWYKELSLLSQTQGVLNSYYAQRRKVTADTKNDKVKEPYMSRCPLTTAYILYMIDRYGSRTHEVLMDYARDSKDILAAFEKARVEGYVSHDGNAHKPYLTEEGRGFLYDYYGNDFNGYDE